nr:arginine--tRNA ligase, chloroplastic/mitochondrial-like isoform X2 [Ipomoea batatas]
MMAICNNSKFGDYQCNNAMSLWAKIKGKGTQFKGPQPVGQVMTLIFAVLGISQFCFNQHSGHQYPLTIKWFLICRLL